MSEKAVDILKEVFTEVLEKQAFMFAVSADRSEFPSEALECVSTEIGFSGNCNGEIHMTVPEHLAVELAANIIGLDVDDDAVDEKALDALREILNIVCGNFITRLYGNTVDMSQTIPETSRKNPNYWAGLLKCSGTQCFLVDDIPVMLGLEEK